LAKRLFCGLFRIGERLVLKNGFKMKQFAIFVRGAEIEFSGVLLNVISVKRVWIWTNSFGDGEKHERWPKVQSETSSISMPLSFLRLSL
jgi:hypothetical protein